MSQPQSQPSSGPPYAPRVAGIGGIPTRIPDIPIASCFLALYLGFAVTNQMVYQTNRRKHHKKFIVSLALFGFCMARTLTMILRIVDTIYTKNVSLGIAANIFLNAGVLIIYIVNLIFAQRILRAEHPHIGWHPLLRWGLRVPYILIGCALIMVIVSSVMSAYTRDTSELSALRDVQLAAITYLFVFTTLPLVLLAISSIVPKQGDQEVFGDGSMVFKKIIVTFSTCSCVLLAGFKLGVTWQTPRPITDPAWYHSKAAFWCFCLVPEILVLALFILSRVDKLFWVPDGSNGPGDYSKGMRRLSTSDGHDLENTAKA